MTNQANLTGPDAGSIVHAPGGPMADLVRAARRIGASDVSVLLTGEAGTGKETIGRLLHASGPRRTWPFATVICGGASEALLETALFGRAGGERSADARRGAMAVACGGTLFLEEIGDLPPALQLKLLRVLQEHVYEPVGSTDAVAADFRLVAATSRDLAADVESGRFRRDLYFRVAVCPMQVPPLRERGEDAVLLFDHLWALRGEARAVEPAVYEVLRTHRWPGNVRELQGLVERLAICAEGATICASDLPPALRRSAPVPPPRTPARRPTPEAPCGSALAGAPPWREDRLPDPGLLGASAIDLTTMLRGLEDAFIDAALARTGGNKKAAAGLLGLQRTTLVEKLRRRRRLGAAGGSPPEGADDERVGAHDA